MIRPMAIPCPRAGFSTVMHGMIQTGKLKDFADAARLCGVTRARMTQIANLLLLAPEIQAAILDLAALTRGRDPVTERQLRPIVAEPIWEQQVAAWNRIAPIRWPPPEDQGC